MAFLFLKYNLNFQSTIVQNLPKLRRDFWQKCVFEFLDVVVGDVDEIMDIVPEEDWHVGQDFAHIERSFFNELLEKIVINRRTIKGSKNNLMKSLK